MPPKKRSIERPTPHPPSPPLTLGIITNPHARAHQWHRSWADARALERVTTSVSEIPGALAAVRGCEYLLVNGGDGTLGAVVTALVAGERPLPIIVPVYGGTNNAVAKDVGAWHRDVAARILAGERGPIVERQTLRVSVGDRERYGFIFATGLVVRFTEAYYRGPGVGSAKAAWVVAAKFAQATVPIERHRAFWRFEPNRVSIDGVPMMLPRGAQLSFVSALNQQILFFKPFPQRVEDIAGFNVLVNALPPRAIAAHLYGLSRGKYVGAGHVAQPAERFEISGTPRFFLDGELYDCRAQERITVTPGPRVRFLVG
jgi:hypothetical protein